MFIDKVKISIITIVLNDKDNIENTILSVINQNIKNLEYIILDGGSIDGTLEIIEKYKDKIDVFESQKDNGIYDAMNKAVKKASGEWICFMNSGDTFIIHKSIFNLFDKQTNANAQILYGDHQVKCIEKTKIIKATPIENIWKGSVFSHQSCFVKKEILEEYEFNISNKITADYELFYTLFKDNKIFEHIPVLVSSVSCGGVSDIKRIDSIVSRWNILDKSFKINTYYIQLVLTEMLKKFIKKLFARGV